jgi:FkbM family methyltransferase
MGKLNLRLRKLLAMLSDPVYRRGFRFGVAPSVEHSDALSKYDFDCVLDVGANRGQFALFSRRTFPDCQIISFEPLSRPGSIFTRLFERDPKTKLVAAAIATKSGAITMHITEQDDSSSPLDLDEPQKEIFGSSVVERRDVPCGPLKQFLAAGEFGAHTLLKIDTQGFELEVLRAAEDALGDIEAIYCEASFLRLYKEQPLASDVISYLNQKGFTLRGVYNLTVDKHVGPVQADLLFLRA